MTTTLLKILGDLTRDSTPSWMVFLGWFSFLITLFVIMKVHQISPRVELPMAMGAGISCLVFGVGVWRIFSLEVHPLAEVMFVLILATFGCALHILPAYIIYMLFGPPKNNRFWGKRRKR